MKKQTFEILPVSPEERKHLIGLSYNEIGDVLQEKDSLSLISYLNSNSVKIAEMAIITLYHREDFWTVVEEVLDSENQPTVSSESEPEMNESNSVEEKNDDVENSSEPVGKENTNLFSKLKSKAGSIFKKNIDQ